MRLLNTKTQQHESFEDWNTVPPYAILSHTWEEGEVLFHDIANGSAETKPGWKKIIGSCAEAEKLGIFHVWVDTCCIFKESSAELSESINSMFAWYRGARICFAYLGDLDENGEAEMPTRLTTTKNIDGSKWWTRGWTLQELIAPTEVMFFNKRWDFIDLRSSLVEPISKITGVAEEILRGGNLDKLHELSIAQKFSWAAKRRTTRVEDRAYSLMGLFGVNMSMIYGEGEQAAFYRLQKEIFAVYADHSIFAWHYPFEESQKANQKPKTYDLLAPSVSAFEYSQNIINEPYNWNVIGRPKVIKAKDTLSNKTLAEYSAVSHGMRIQMMLEMHYDNYYIAYLACRFQECAQTLLKLVFELEQATGQYRRVGLSEAKEHTLDSFFNYHATLQDVYITPPRLDFTLPHRPVRYQMDNRFFTHGALQSFLTITDVVAVREAHFLPVDYYPPQIDWEGTPGTSKVGISLGLWLWHDDRNSAVIYRHDKTAESFAVVIGTDQKFDPETPEDTKFLAAIVDDIDTGATAADVLDNFFEQSDHTLTDLSTQILVERLNSGKKVMLSVNAKTEKACVSQKIELTYQAFRLWISVREAGISP